MVERLYLSRANASPIRIVTSVISASLERPNVADDGVREVLDLAQAMGSFGRG
jgi:hypothetical protein